MRRMLVLVFAVAALVGAAGADGALPPPPPPPATDTFSNPPGSLLLQVNIQGWGDGYVRSFNPTDPFGFMFGFYIDCPLACIRPIDRGSSFLLLAAPTPGFTFMGWQVAKHGQPETPGACPGTGPCLLSNISQSMDVVALFSGKFEGPPEPSSSIPGCHDLEECDGG